MATVTLEDVLAQVTQMRVELARANARGERLEAVIAVLLARYGDPSHVTVEEAAALKRKITGKGSVASIRHMIRQKRLTLEVIPGTRRTGIPLHQMYNEWLPIDLVRRIVAKAKGER